MSDYWTIICRARKKRVDIFRCLSNGIVTNCILIHWPPIIFAFIRWNFRESNIQIKNWTWSKTLHIQSYQSFLIPIYHLAEKSKLHKMLLNFSTLINVQTNVVDHICFTIQANKLVGFARCHGWRSLTVDSFLCQDIRRDTGIILLFVLHSN